MKFFKLFLKLAAIVSGLSVLGLAIIYLAFRLDKGGEILAWAIQQSSGYQLVFDGTSEIKISGSSGIIVLETVTIRNPDNPTSHNATIGKLTVELDLLRMLGGTLQFHQFKAEDAVLELVHHFHNVSDHHRHLTNIPVVDDIELINVQVNWHDPKTGQAISTSIEHLTLGDEDESGPLLLDAKGTINGVQFRMFGRLGSVSEALDPYALFAIDISIVGDNLRASVNGTVNDFTGVGRLDVDVELDMDVPKVLSDHLAMEVLQGGRMTAEVAITGAMSAPVVSSFSAHMKLQSGDISVKGEIAELIHLDGVAGSFSSRLSANALPFPFPIGWVPSAPVSMTGKFSGGKEWRVDDLIVELPLEQGGMVSARGRANFHWQSQQDLEVSYASFELKLQADRFDVSRWLPDQGQFDLENVTASALMEFSDDKLNFNKAKFEADHASGLKVTMTDGQGELLANGTFQNAVGNARILAQSTAMVGSLIQAHIPELGAVDGTAKISLQDGEILLKQLRLLIGDTSKPILYVTGKAKVSQSGQISFDARTTLSEFDGKTLTRLVPSWDPRIDQISGVAKVKGTLDSAQATGLELVATGPGSVVWNISGNIGEVFDGFSDVDVGVKLSAQNAADLSDLIGIQVPPVSKIFASGNITDEGGKLSLSIDHGIINFDSGAVLEFQARLADIANPKEGSLNFQLEDPDGRLIAGLSGNAIEYHLPVRIGGSAARMGDKSKFSGLIVSGESRVRFNLLAEPGALRPKISGLIQSSRLVLDDLIISEPEVITKHREGRAQIFSDWKYDFTGLGEFDLDINIDIDAALFGDWDINTIDGHLKLADRKLTIDGLKLVYGAGEWHSQLVLDASHEIPRFELRSVGEDIDSYDALKPMISDPSFSGELHLNIDLKSRGRSMKEIASNLSGPFAIALENGEFSGREIDRLKQGIFEIIVGNIISNKEKSPISCLIAKGRFNNGVATFGALFIETDKNQFSGHGKVDFNQEQLDLQFGSAARSALNVDSEVKIQGSILDPVIKVTPTNQVLGSAEVTGTVFAPFIMGPFILLKELKKLVVENEEVTPCQRKG